MRTLTAWSMLVVAPVTIMFAAGCRDEVAVTLDEIETVQQEILALLEQRVETTAENAAAAAAVEENTSTALENSGMVLRANVWRSKDPTSRRSCGGFIPAATEAADSLCSAWKEARREARGANSRQVGAQRTVNNRTSRYAQWLEALRRAHEDDTWDAIALARTGNPGASARSIAITYLRELEDERTRLQSLAAESQP
jgi:hypothetical protein